MTGDFDFPFEDVPGGPVDWQGPDPHLANGLIIMSVLLPGTDGRDVPGVMFRFSKPGGSDFYRPTIVPIDAEVGERMVDMIASAVASAQRMAGG